MRIFDMSDVELSLEQVDYEKGYLCPEQRFVAHHEAVPAVKEQGHWETIARYPNGGEDVQWKVDVPGAEAREAWDEYEEIQRFVAFTPEQLAQQEAGRQREARLDALLQQGVLREELAEVVSGLLRELLSRMWSGTEGVEEYGDY